MIVEPLENTLSTVTELVARVRIMTETDLTTLQDDTDLIALINEAYVEVWNSTTWPFAIVSETFTLADGESSKVLATSKVRWIDAVWITVEGQDYELSQRAAYPSDSSTAGGRPEWYWITPAGVMHFFPEANASYAVTVRVGTGPATLSGSSTPAFDEEFHPVLAYIAAAKLLKRQRDDTGLVAEYTMDADKYLEMMRTSYRGPVRRPFVIGDAVAQNVRLRFSNRYRWRV